MKKPEINVSIPGAAPGVIAALSAIQENISLITGQKGGKILTTKGIQSPSVGDVRTNAVVGVTTRNVAGGSGTTTVNVGFKPSDVITLIGLNSAFVQSIAIGFSDGVTNWHISGSLTVGGFIVASPSALGPYNGSPDYAAWNVNNFTNTGFDVVCTVNGAPTGIVYVAYIARRDIAANGPLALSSEVSQLVLRVSDIETKYNALVARLNTP